jgi:hypothetical protein
MNRSSSNVDGDSDRAVEAHPRITIKTAGITALKTEGL